MIVTKKEKWKIIRKIDIKNKGDEKIATNQKERNETKRKETKRKEQNRNERIDKIG